jgi:hypothetical protein
MFYISSVSSEPQQLFPSRLPMKGPFFQYGYEPRARSTPTPLHSGGYDLEESACEASEGCPVSSRGLPQFIPMMCVRVATLLIFQWVHPGKPIQITQFNSWGEPGWKQMQILKGWHYLTIYDFLLYVRSELWIVRNFRSSHMPPLLLEKAPKPVRCTSSQLIPARANSCTSGSVHFWKALKLVFAGKGHLLKTERGLTYAFSMF